jgi:hypothetical protein
MNLWERTVVDHQRLERFRELLTRYRSVWGFAPPKAQFVRLWQRSETEDSMRQEVQRLAGD